MSTEIVTILIGNINAGKFALATQIYDELLKISTEEKLAELIERLADENNGTKFIEHLNGRHNGTEDKVPPSP